MHMGPGLDDRGCLLSTGSSAGHLSPFNLVLQIYFYIHFVFIHMYRHQFVTHVEKIISTNKSR